MQGVIDLSSAVMRYNVEMDVSSITSASLKHYLISACTNMIAVEIVLVFIRIHTVQYF